MCWWQPVCSFVACSDGLFLWYLLGPAEDERSFQTATATLFARLQDIPHGAVRRLTLFAEGIRRRAQ